MTGPRQVAVADEAGTRLLAADIAAAVRPGDVIALRGDLGAGKSAFARALIRALADDPDLEVPSPTFTLVQGYATPALAVAHFDLYRLGDADELVELGFDEAVATGLTLVEWPERAGAVIPADRLDVDILAGETPDGRIFRFRAGSGDWADRVDATLAVRDMLAGAGFGAASRRRVKGDASTRAFERVSLDGRTAIVMLWPPFGPRPPLADGLAYEDLVHVTDSLAAFVAIADMLRRTGFRAPRILEADYLRRIALLEDLGTDAIVRGGRPIAARYLAAARRLADIAALPWPAIATADDGRRWRLPAYDRRALLTEVGLFADWYVPRAFGRRLGNGERDEFLALWDGLLAGVGDGRTTLVLRDYHSPNIFWQEGADDPIGLIDFQDALLGPAAYDLASLVTDARVDIDDGLARAMLDAYAERRRADDPDFDQARLESEVVVLGAQRNAKILGRFVEYAERSGRTAHLAFLPRVRGNLEKALAHPVLAGLKLWYERLGPDAR